MSSGMGYSQTNRPLHSTIYQTRLTHLYGTIRWPNPFLSPFFKAYLTSKYLETHVRGLLGSTCLELGAGTGLVSVVAWLLGASRVLATDLAGPHIEHVQRNTSANATRIALERQQALLKAGDETQQVWQQQQQLECDSTISRRRLRFDMLRTIGLKSENLHVAPLDW